MSKSEISKEKPENSKIFTIIESLCKEAGVSVTRVCTDITGNKGNLPTWKKGNINTTSLIKLTEYFDVSADYLLGRTDNPKESGIKSGDITGDHNSGNTGSVNIGVSSQEAFPETHDSFTKKFMLVFDSLDFDKQVAVVNYALEQAKKSA